MLYDSQTVTAKEPDLKVMDTNVDQDCNSASIARNFEAALTQQDEAGDLDPPLKGLSDDPGKWCPALLPEGSAPLTVQRAITLLSRPAIKPKAVRRKSVNDLPAISSL